MEDHKQELKPCPFCGNEDLTIKLFEAEKPPYFQFSDKHMVICEYTGDEKGCGAAGMLSKYIGECIEHWNNRPSAEAPMLRPLEERLLISILRAIETEDINPPYRALPPIDPRVIELKAKRILNLCGTPAPNEELDKEAGIKALSILRQFASKLETLPPELNKIIDENFWELIESKTANKLKTTEGT